MCTCIYLYRSVYTHPTTATCVPFNRETKGVLQGVAAARIRTRKQTAGSRLGNGRSAEAADRLATRSSPAVVAGRCSSRKWTFRRASRSGARSATGTRARTQSGCREVFMERLWMVIVPLAPCVVRPMSERLLCASHVPRRSACCPAVSTRFVACAWQVAAAKC